MCGAGVAMSALIADRVNEYCVSRGLKADVFQATVMDLLSPQFCADAIVATVMIPDSIGIPHVSGMALLLGTDPTGTFEALDSILGVGP